MSNLPSSAYTIDFETTDIDPKKAHPLEVALVNNKGDFIVSLIKPPISIPPETSAVHHITDQDVVDADSWEIVKGYLRACVMQNGAPLMIAHNAQYEQAIIGDLLPEAKWICTYKCALVVWPDAPAHRNEVLRYWLCLPELGRAHSQQAHSALHDAVVTHQIVIELLKHKTLEELIKISSEPTQLPYIPIGKHYKQKWTDPSVPAQYLEWLVNTVDMREDVKACARKELERRRPQVKKG